MSSAHKGAHKKNHPSQTNTINEQKLATLFSKPLLLTSGDGIGGSWRCFLEYEDSLRTTDITILTESEGTESSARESACAVRREIYFGKKKRLKNLLYKPIILNSEPQRTAASLSRFSLQRCATPLQHEKDAHKLKKTEHTTSSMESLSLACPHAPDSAPPAAAARGAAAPGVASLESVASSGNRSPGARAYHHLLDYAADRWRGLWTIQLS